jgi:hypothetical protein
MYYYLLIVTFFFILHIETSVGNIFLRINDKGIIIFNFNSLFSYCIHPLHNSFLWDPKLLDVNYIFIILISIIIYLIVNDII